MLIESVVTCQHMVIISSPMEVVNIILISNRAVVFFSIFYFILVFRWGIHIAEKKHHLYPQNVYTHQEKGIFIFQPFLSKHITHFIETVNHLLNKLADRSLYPYVLILFILSFLVVNCLFTFI